MMTFGIKKQPPAKHASPVKRIRIWHKRSREPLLTVLLAVQIFILFIMPTVRAMGLLIPHIAIWGVFLFFVVLASILSRSRVAIVTMIISMILTIGTAIWQYEQSNVLTEALSTTGQILTQLSLLWIVSTAVFGPGRITPHRILGAVVMYLTIGMIFTSLYLLLIHIVPNAFAQTSLNNVELRETMNYYSFGALTTGGAGNVIPLDPIARSLSNVESICGQLFPATLLARIVGMHGSRKS